MQKDPVQKPAGPSRVSPASLEGFALQGVLSFPQAFLGFLTKNFRSGPRPNVVSLFSFSLGLSPGLSLSGQGVWVRFVAVLDIKSNKPSAHRQFQSGWKQAERYFARNYL